MTAVEVCELGVAVARNSKLEREFRRRLIELPKANRLKAAEIMVALGEDENWCNRHTATIYISRTLAELDNRNTGSGEHVIFDQLSRLWANLAIDPEYRVRLDTNTALRQAIDEERLSPSKLSHVVDDLMLAMSGRGGRY